MSTNYNEDLNATNAFVISLIKVQSFKLLSNSQMERYRRKLAENTHRETMVKLRRQFELNWYPLCGASIITKDIKLCHVKGEEAADQGIKPQNDRKFGSFPDELPRSWGMNANVKKISTKNILQTFMKKICGYSFYFYSSILKTTLIISKKSMKIKTLNCINTLTFNQSTFHTRFLFFTHFAEGLSRKASLQRAFRRRNEVGVAESCEWCQQFR